MRNTLEGKLGVAGGGMAGQELNLKKVLKTQVSWVASLKVNSTLLEWKISYIHHGLHYLVIFVYFFVSLRFQSQIFYVGGLYRVGYM